MDFDDMGLNKVIEPEDLSDLHDDIIVTRLLFAELVGAVENICRELISKTREANSPDTYDKFMEETAKIIMVIRERNIDCSFKVLRLYERLTGEQFPLNHAILNELYRGPGSMLPPDDSDDTGGGDR